jgi:hypothetical protein
LPGSAFGAEPTLRAELFGTEQMESHGLRLAAADRLAPGRGPELLLGRLAANGRGLTETWDLLTSAVAAKRRVTPAGECLLDNAYLIAEQIRTARRHLPKGYSRELPILAAGTASGLPRGNIGDRADTRGLGCGKARKSLPALSASPSVPPADVAWGELKGSEKNGLGGEGERAGRDARLSPLSGSRR